MYLFSKKYLWLLLSLSLLENSFVTAFQRENDHAQDNYITTEEKKLQYQIVTFFKEHEKTIAASGVTLLLTFIFTYMLVDYKKNKELKRKDSELINVKSRLESCEKIINDLKDILQEDEIENVYASILEFCKDKNLIDKDRLEVLQNLSKQQINDLNSQKEGLEQEIEDLKEQKNELEDTNNYHQQVEQLVNDIEQKQNALDELNEKVEIAKEQLEQLEQLQQSVQNNQNIQNNNNKIYELNNDDQNNYYQDIINENIHLKDCNNELKVLLAKHDNTYVENNFAKKEGLLPDECKFIGFDIDENDKILFSEIYNYNAIGKINISSVEGKLAYMYVHSICNNKALSELNCHYIFVPFLQEEHNITVDTLEKSVDMFVNNEFEKDCNRIITVIYGAVSTDNDTNTEDFKLVNYYTDYVKEYKGQFKSQEIITLIAIGDKNLEIALEIIDHYNGLDYQDKNNKEYLWDLKNKRGAFDLSNTVLMTLGIDVTKARYLLDLVEYNDIPQKNKNMPKQNIQLPLIGSIINLYGTGTPQLKNKIAEGAASFVKYIDCRVCVNNEYNLIKKQFIPTALQFLSFEYDVLKQSSGFMTNMCLHIKKESNDYVCTMAARAIGKKKSLNCGRLEYTDEDIIKSEKLIFTTNMMKLEENYENIEEKDLVLQIYNMTADNFVTENLSNTGYEIGKYATNTLYNGCQYGVKKTFNGFTYMFRKGTEYFNINNDDISKIE